MQGGGAERVVSVLANHFASMGFRSSVAVVRGDSVYPLADGVALRRMYQEEEFAGTLWNKIWRRLVYAPRLWSLVVQERPDVVIPVHGGGWNGQFVLLCWLLRIKVIAAEHISWTVGRHQWGRWFERRIIYRLADAVTVLTEADKAYYAQYLPRVVKIPNPLSFDTASVEEGRGQTILAVGRLDSWHHKGFDTLLEVFALVHPSIPGWRLQIAGAGTTGRKYLESLAKKLGVAEWVDFVGFQQDVASLMRRTEIFVLSSRFEGFPMVLLEAMSQGCACISFNCRSGPSDIIKSNEDGILIPDQDKVAMAEGLTRLMQDQQLRSTLGRAAIKKARHYSVDVVGSCWLSLFKSIGVPA